MFIAIYLSTISQYIITRYKLLQVVASYYMLGSLKGVYALTRALPKEVIQMIVLFILSTGTPHCKIMREYIDRAMYILPPQRSDDIRTLWRYHMYLNQYRLMDNLTCMSASNKQVHYEFVLALLESEDCFTYLASKSEVFVSGLKYHVGFTLTKLFQIYIHRLALGPKIKPTPSASVIKRWFNKKKVGELRF